MRTTVPTGFTPQSDSSPRRRASAFISALSLQQFRRRESAELLLPSGEQLKSIAREIHVRSPATDHREHQGLEGPGYDRTDAVGPVAVGRLQGEATNAPLRADQQV